MHYYDRYHVPSGVGLMEIATKAGIIEQLSRKLKPLIHFLFPNLPDNHPAATHITTNIMLTF